MPEFLQFLFSGLTIGAIYALVALGFTLIYNASDVINFAQGEFVMIGGMVTFFAVAAGVPLPLAALLALVDRGPGRALLHMVSRSSRRARRIAGDAHHHHHRRVDLPARRRGDCVRQEFPQLSRHLPAPSRSRSAARASCRKA